MRTLLLTTCLLLLNGCYSLAIVRGPNQNTDKLRIEIDWTTPTPPDPAVLQQVAAQIKAACAPNVQVIFTLDDDLSAKAKGQWSTAGLKAFTFFHRTKGQDVFYLLWCDGQYENKPTVGGFSWGKRAFAIFPAACPNQAALRTATTHEMFHNLGLVDKYLKMQTHHKHSYGKHCDKPGCLMQPVSGAYPYNPCSFCIADLEAGEEK